MTLQQRDLFIRHIFSTMAPYLDLLSSGFSLGLDHLWRIKAVNLLNVHEGDRVLDVCTGTGELAFLLSPKVGKSGSVTGADFCEEMLVRARKKKTRKHANVSFVLSDAKRVPFPDKSFDAVTVAFGMRNIPDTILALNEIKRVLKPGGKFVCLELTKPHAKWLSSLYKFYVFNVMPSIAQVIIKTAAPYLYLPRSINAFYPPEEFRRVITECGYSKVSIESLSMGIATIYRAAKP